jgi:oligopeptide/dipeptide ABC transporter ATP-binding protein
VTTREKTRDIVLAVRDLHVAFPNSETGELVDVLRGVTLQVEAGRVLGLVGESGSGKSMTVFSTLRLLPSSGMVRSGEILVDGVNILDISESEMRKIRGHTIGTVFQDPMTSLNPVRRISTVLMETVRRHEKLTRKEAKVRALATLREVGIPAPEERLRAYPHQLSGGLRQRVMIAHALISHPRLILADEPTTALDTTTQAQILKLMKERLSKASVLFITHDLGVASELCDEIAVLYAGRVVESGPTQDLLLHPRHPYTAGLLAAVPRFSRDKSPLKVIPGDPLKVTSEIEGCAFAPRCSRATPQCLTEDPPLKPTTHSGQVACWNPEESK